MKDRILNWKPDPRHYFRAAVKLDEPASPIGQRVDLSGPAFPPIYDQGKRGSCTAQALAAVYHFQLYDQGIKTFLPSRYFIYWNERNMEGTTSTDSGAIIADGAKVLNTLGVCDETVWPHDDPLWDDKPSDAAFAVALKSKATEVVPLTESVEQVCRALWAGFPVVCGIPIFDNFSEASFDGIVPMPGDDSAYRGGHAIVIVGYFLDSKDYLWFKCRNSWGKGWGDKGHFALPWEYLERGASDFWTIRRVESMIP